MDVRRIRADEWRLWREARLRMLREEAAYFSTRYDDAVREPEAVWQTWTAEAADGVDKVLFVAEDGGATLGVVGAFRRLDPAEVQLVSLWVDPQARGRGVAGSLIQAVAAWARDGRCAPSRQWAESGHGLHEQIQKSFFPFIFRSILIMF